MLLALAVWRWYVTKRDKEKLLLDIQEMGEIAQYEEPLLSIAPEPLKKVAVTEMGGLVTDLVMIGGGAFGTLSPELKSNDSNSSHFTHEHALYFVHFVYF
jgi:hypothetical protein